MKQGLPTYQTRSKQALWSIFCSPRAQTLVSQYYHFMVFQHSIQKQCSAIICELIGRVEAGFSIQYLRGREAMLLWKEQVLVCDVWIDQHKKHNARAQRQGCHQVHIPLG